MVRVSGYTRSNGTYVSGYTRSSHSSSSHSSSSSSKSSSSKSSYSSSLALASSNKTYVNGYYRNDGTYVNGYTRSSNSKSSNDVRIKGYYKNDGTYVKSYTRSLPKSRISNMSSIIKQWNIIPAISYDTDEIVDILPELFDTDEVNTDDNQSAKLNDKKINYKIVNTENLSTDMICPISQDLMLNPVKTKCSHTFDKDYLCKWLSKNNSCPICRSRIDTNDLIIDNNILKKLEKLEFIIDKKDNDIKLDEDEVTYLDKLFGYISIEDKFSFRTLIKKLNE